MFTQLPTTKPSDDSLPVRTKEEENLNLRLFLIPSLLCVDPSFYDRNNDWFDGPKIQVYSDVCQRDLTSLLMRVEARVLTTHWRREREPVVTGRTQGTDTTNRSRSSRSESTRSSGDDRFGTTLPSPLDSHDEDEVGTGFDPSSPWGRDGEHRSFRSTSYFG